MEELVEFVMVIITNMAIMVVMAIMPVMHVMAILTQMATMTVIPISTVLAATSISFFLYWFVMAIVSVMNRLAGIVIAVIIALAVMVIIV